MVYIPELPQSEPSQDERDLKNFKDNAIAQNLPYWEWNGIEKRFTASRKWEELTGYSAAKLFPASLPSDIQIRTVIDNFIARWMRIVEPEYRQDATEAAETFLLFNEKSASFSHYYKLRCKDNSVKMVHSTARSLWVQGTLVSVFSVVEDISKLTASPEVVFALSKNEEKTKKLESKLSALKEQAIKIGTWAKLWPLLTAVIVGFNDQIELAKNQIARTWNLFTTPIEDVHLPAVGDYLPEQATPEAWAKVEEIVVANAPTSILRAEVVAYEPGQFPESYKPILRLDYGNGKSLRSADAANKQPVKVVSIASAGERRDDHIAGQPFEYKLKEGDTAYSAPFWIVRTDGRQQLLYVELTAKNSTDSDDVIKSAKRISELLRNYLEGQTN